VFGAAPTLGQAINAGYRFLRVRSTGCKQHYGAAC
jgi:hypothetical protein